MEHITQKLADAYIEALLWSSGEEFDGKELSQRAEVQARADCIAFYDANYLHLNAYCQQRNCTIDYAGHDFALTRNGHGAGFWDRFEVREHIREYLTRSSDTFGPCELYIGDDGSVHFS